MSTESLLWHEKLHVYQRTLAFYSRAEESILCSPPEIAAMDHLERAVESILENIANGNSSWSIDARRQYFGVACGSVLECAGCLDILHIRGRLTPDLWHKEKCELCRIAQMLVGLIRSDRNQVREDAAEWQIETPPATAILFDHERLDVYQLGLDFIRWVEPVIAKENLSSRHAGRLDILSTSIVLNVAEGNGRFQALDHRKFVDIAYQSAIKSLVLLDLAETQNSITSLDAQNAKTMLSRIVKMLLGMRGYLQEHA